MPTLPPIPLSVATSTGGLGLGTTLDDLAAQAQAAEATTVSVPQFAYAANLDERTWKAIDRFEQRVVRDHARNDDPDSVFFGQNTSLWFKSLVQRDIGELGADAIVTSGVMLWGRFQKTPQAQRRVEGWLRSIAARAKIEFNLQRPDPELWWTPVWRRVVKDPQASPRLLASILQQVRADQAVTPAYEGDLVQIWLERFMLDYHDSARAFDVHEEVRTLLDGPPIVLEGRTRSRDAETTVFLGREAQRHRWDLVNQKLIEIFPDALGEEDLAMCVARMAAFRGAFNLRFAPHRILPKLGAIAETPWTAIAGALTQVAHTYADLGAAQAAQPAPMGLPGRRRPILMPAVRPEKAVFQWAHCGFALAVLGDARAAECFRQVDALLPSAAGLNPGDRRRLSALKHGDAGALNLQGRAAEVLAEAREGAWEEALALLSSTTDLDERMEVLAGLVHSYKEQSFRLTLPVGRDVTIGRRSDNDWALEDTAISGHHAKLRLAPGPGGELVVVLQDLGSTNGITFAETGAQLDPRQDYTLPPGESVRLAGKILLYNGLQNARSVDEIVLKRGIEEGEWILQNKPQAAAAAPVAGSADPLASLQWYQRLPKRDRASIPEDLHDDIPDERGFDDIVLTPRFLRTLNETAGMVANPRRMAVRYIGPPGTGKTTIPAMVAAKMGAPLYRFVFSPRTDPSDVEGLWDFEMVPKLDSKGQPVMEDDGVTPVMEYKRVYREGVATTAMENGGHLVWDEPDLGRPGMLAFLNDVSDPDEYVWVKKTDGNLVPIKVHEGYRCYVTENGRTQIARQEHGEDFLRRFVPYYVDRWSEEETAQVLTERYEMQGGRRNWSRKTTEVLAKVHDRLCFLASSFEDPVTRAPMIPLGSGVQQTVEFTPRSILRLAERLIRSGPMTPETFSRAIRAEYLLPLWDPDDRNQVWQQIQPLLQPLIREMGWAADAVGPQAIPAPTLRGIEQKYLGGRRVPRDGFAWTDWAIQAVDESLWNRSLGIDVLWLGDAGIGKTMTPKQISKILGEKHFKGKMSGQTEEGDLIGIPGPKGFQRGLVTLAVEEGGIGHFDEALLLQPGRFESVFGPLMDGAQALLIKNPRRVVKRVPGKTFFIFTSNPPFGNFAGKDRYEQSGAAMSRMAVMCMTGDFGMTAKDRLQIRMHESPPPEVRVPLPPKKKVLSAGPEVPPDPSTVLKMADTAAPSEPGRFPLVEVHTDFRKEPYGLPAYLGVDMKNLEVLEPDGFGGLQKASAETMQGLDRLSEYLKRRTQFEMAPVVRRIINMTFRFFGPQMANLATKRAFFNIIDLLRFSLTGALGVGKHEWAHQILDALHPKYFAHEPGRLLFNVMADPRMQEFVASLAQGLFKAQAQEVNETQWPVVWEEADQKRWLARRLPHEQFADAVIHFWRSGVLMPWIEDPKVREALEEAKPFLTAAAHALPKSLSNEDIAAARTEFYKQVDQVWPIYERLFGEGMKKILERLENGETPEDIIGEVMDKILEGINLPLGEGDKVDPEKLAQAIFNARAEILADRHEPNDPDKFAERKEGIRVLKTGGAGKPTLPPADPAPPAPPTAPAPGLSPKDLLEVGIREVDRQQIEGNLYRELLAKVPKVARLLARLKKTLPAVRPIDLEGHFRQGRRDDPKKMFQNDMAPVPDGREKLRDGPPVDVEANIVVATDVSGSMVLSGADDNALLASAVSIFFSEGLDLRYGELLFGSAVESAKPLGKRLGTYALKNEMLNKKKQAFYDGKLGGGTDIRSALAKSIEWIKKKRSKADFIILITDGSENDTSYPKTLQELEAECEKEGIELMILAMGQAQAFIPQHFKPEHYRFVAPDGSDIPDIMIEMFEKAHRKRLPKR